MVAFEKCVWAQGSDDTEVWIARPQELDAATVAVQHAWLDSSERTQAARFRSVADQRAYTVAHALQRWLLSRALDCAPAAVQLAPGPSGKPVLLDPAPGALPFFNLSHTREAVACAISWRRSVGIDLECVQSPAGVEPRLLDPFIARVSQHLNAACSETARNHQLYLLWTALESYWKARGDGLVNGRPRLALRTVADGAIEIRHEEDAATCAPRARVRSTDAVSGHVMCVAAACAPTH